MKKRIIVLAIAIVCNFITTGKISAQEQEPSVTADSSHTLDKFIEKKMEEAGIIGLGAAIIVDKKVVWMKGYGFADKENKLPFTPETTMKTASISKTFTGVALMRAVEAGKLSLDEDVNTYLPFKIINPYFPNEKITLRQLATHTSSISSHWPVERDLYYFDKKTAEPLEDFLKSYFVPGGSRFHSEIFLKVKPGTHREYSNFGAALAGYIAERALGEGLNSYIKKEVFSPLGMNNSGYNLFKKERKRQSKLYVSHYHFSFLIPHYALTTYPAGGVHSSVSDISKFFIALLNDGEYEGARILKEESAKEMLRFQWTESNKPDNVNVGNKNSVNSGIFWSSKYDISRMGNNGTDPGVNTSMLSDIPREVGVILFLNTSFTGEERIHEMLIFEELWKHAEGLKNK